MTDKKFCDFCGNEITYPKSDTEIWYASISVYQGVAGIDHKDCCKDCIPKVISGVKTK